MRFSFSLPPAVLAWVLAGPSAHAQPSATAEERQDRETLSGLGTALNFRGVANELDVDVTMSASGSARQAVEALRLSARAIVLPAAGRAAASWAGWVGVRASGLHYATLSGSNDDAPALGFIPANLEPTLGVVVESVADEVRFEADVAPVVSMAQYSQVAAQAAIAAAMSTAPHDDLLFLPNVQGGARLRLALSRRFELSPRAFWAVGAEVETGYARTATPIGTSAGRTGGGALSAQLYVRPRRFFVEGFGVAAVADVGYTAIWAANVVLPMLLGGGPTVEISRGLEARVLVSAFAQNPLASGDFKLDSWSATAGLRWSLGREPAGWTSRQVQAEPELDEQSGN